jgi:hypothetical protein
VCVCVCVCVRWGGEGGWTCPAWHLGITHGGRLAVVLLVHGRGSAWVPPIVGVLSGPTF